MRPPCQSTPIPLPSTNPFPSLVQVCWAAHDDLISAKSGRETHFVPAWEPRARSSGSLNKQVDRTTKPITRRAADNPTKSQNAAARAPWAVRRMSGPGSALGARSVRSLDGGVRCALSSWASMTPQRHTFAFPPTRIFPQPFFSPLSTSPPLSRHLNILTPNPMSSQPISDLYHTSHEDFAADSNAEEDAEQTPQGGPGRNMSPGKYEFAPDDLPTPRSATRTCGARRSSRAPIIPACATRGGSWPLCCTSSSTLS